MMVFEFDKAELLLPLLAGLPWPFLPPNSLLTDLFSPFASSRRKKSSKNKRVRRGFLRSDLKNLKIF